ncbi:hypothetical protein KFL_005120030 [Klebsormidium nitens]|uniref:Uncharacterized protein n=1 Tax=Klebsormidium nitens TaxID=105231 RepID=A0A1Y1IGZ4_KLENI|nr:hypothetical protein KFL_005120030 [Klebsormidium nitens]|eukprot:GAQ89332.1 hypothetical protein KFL_005120030 [Klebsormidium nitens]
MGGRPKDLLEGQVNATQAEYLDPDALTAINACFNRLNGKCPDSPAKMAGGNPFFNVTSGTMSYLMKQYCWANCVSARNSMAACADNVISQYDLNATMAPLYYPPAEAAAAIATANIVVTMRSLAGSDTITTSAAAVAASNADLAEQILNWCEVNDPNLKVVMYSGASRRGVLTALGLLAGLMSAVAAIGL